MLEDPATAQGAHAPTRTAAFCPAHFLTNRGICFLFLPSVALRLQSQSAGTCPPTRQRPGGRGGNDPDSFAPELESTLPGLAASLQLSTPFIDLGCINHQTQNNCILVTIPCIWKPTCRRCCFPSQ